MRSLTLALLSTTALLATASVAAAQTVDEAGAREIEASVTAIMDQALQNAPDATYRFDGEVVAVPSGDSYRLTIPQMTVQIDDVAVEVPAMDNVVTPLANGWQRWQGDFPSTMRVYNPRGDENVDITLSSTNNDMIYAPDYGVSMDGDVSFEDVTAVLREGDSTEGTITVASLEMSVETEEVAGVADTYDAVSAFNLSSLSVDVPGEDVSFAMGSLEITGATERQRLDLFAILQEALRGLDAESEAFAGAYLDVLRAHSDEKWLGAGTLGFALNDLSFASEEASGSIATITFEAEAEGLDQSSADFGVLLEASDMASPQLPAAFAPIVPTTARLDVEANDAPLEALMAEVYSTLESAGEPELGPKGVRMGTGGGNVQALASMDPMAVLGLLLQSDALLEINALFVEAPIGYVAAEGTIDPDPSAAFSAVADISLHIAGLPDMISFAQQMGGDAAQAAGLASAIAAMGRDGTDEDGTAIKEFDFQLTASGEMLLNGNDLSAMMGMFQ